MNAESKDTNNQPIQPETHQAMFSTRDKRRGELLIAFFILFGIAILTLAGLVSYRVVKVSSTEGVSITAIPKEGPAPDSVTDESVASEETTPVVAPDPKQADILVLNGGAAKGSAGVLGSALEKLGYAKVEVGNATLDYIGVTVYSSKENKSVAEEVKKDILKRYPKAEWKTADPKKPETAKATIVIVLGK